MFPTNYYLLFDRIEIQAANAVSGPLTYGFPALSGFVGAIHALSRKLSHKSVELGGVMIACHHYELQTNQNSPYSDRTFNQTRNPLKRNGETASIIEEGKIHLTVSLVVEVNVKDTDLYYELEDTASESAVDFCQELQNLLWQQRIAGGTVLKIRKTKLFALHEENDIPAALMPAFVLMDAKSELVEITRQLRQGINSDDVQLLVPNPDASALDALLESAVLHHIPNTPNADSDNWSVYSVKKNRGWLVPMPIGYQGISPQFAAGELQNCRTNEYPSQYVEALYTLGKWVFPLSLPDDISQCFWHYNARQNNLYLISQGEQHG